MLENESFDEALEEIVVEEEQTKKEEVKVQGVVPVDNDLQPDGSLVDSVAGSVTGIVRSMQHLT